MMLWDLIFIINSPHSLALLHNPQMMKWFIAVYLIRDLNIKSIFWRKKIDSHDSFFEEVTQRRHDDILPVAIFVFPIMFLTQTPIHCSSPWNERTQEKENTLQWQFVHERGIEWIKRCTHILSQACDVMITCSISHNRESSVRLWIDRPNAFFLIFRVIELESI